jgi:hypothetical protein
MGSGFFTLDSESPMNVIPSRRLKLTGPQPDEIALYLDAHTVRPGQSNTELKVTIFKITTEQETHETFNTPFDIPDITHSFSAGLLGGVLHIVQNTSLYTPLVAHYF